MNIRMVFISLILVLAFTGIGFAVPFSDLAEKPDSEYPLSDTIRWEDGMIPILNLLPDVPGADIIRTRFLNYQPEVTVQRLYRMPLTEQKRRELFTAIVNAFGNPVDQDKYTYHSETRDKDINLFEDSYISDKDGDRKESFSYSSYNLPEKIEYYQFVDEANFSGTVLKQTIRVNDEYLTFHSTNTERMWVSIIPIMKARGSRNELLAFVDSGYLYIYNSSQIAKVPAAKRLGLPIHLPSMFRKRMDVMIAWLSDEISDWIK